MLKVAAYGASISSVSCDQKGFYHGVFFFLMALHYFCIQLVLSRFLFSSLTHFKKSLKNIVEVVRTMPVVT